MKHLLFPLCAALVFSSCAGVHVSHVQTAAVVTDRPHAIYIRPFSVEGATYDGDTAGGPGERPIRESLAPAQFGQDLQDELAKLAPSYVLKPSEAAPAGWLVTGSIERVSGGRRVLRLAGPPALNPLGRSKIVLHVKVIDLDTPAIASDEKSEGTMRKHGRTIYEFDVEGGSRLSGAVGTETAPGVGFATAFDYRNAAERIRVALDIDTHRFGQRNSQELR